MSEVLRAADALADAVNTFLAPGAEDDPEAWISIVNARDDFRAARDAAVIRPADEPDSTAGKWFVFNEITDERVAGPFDSYEDARDYCGEFDDVYPASRFKVD